MALKDILRKVAAEAGMQEYATNEAQKNILLDRINEAALEVYESSDLPGCLREVYVRAYSEEELALPQFVGQVRAIRENDEPHLSWKILNLRPRYHNKDWSSLWKSWTVKGPSPIQMDVNNSAPPIASIPVADAELTVTITGATALSARRQETVTMTSTSVSFTQLFVTYESIVKNIVSDYDVTIKDIEDAELAVIPNDCLESRYMILDISKYPFLERASSEGRIMEILYKERLPRLHNDFDIFPVADYDDAIVLKAKQLIAEDKPGEEERAILMSRKLESLAFRKREDREKGQSRKMHFGDSPFYNLYDSYRWPL